MKMVLLAAPVLAGAVVAMVQAPVVPPMKMGLWEVSTNMKMTMPGMPSGMPGMGPRTILLQSCLTPETYQKYMGQTQQMRDCTRTNEVWTAHGYSFDVSCNGGQMTGHSEGTFDSPEANHGTVHMEMNGGRSMTMDATASSKWISSDCGSVSPDKPKIVK